ncbi:MAG: hypothetical protein SOW25_05605 [Helicobacter sp.]|nr:hypothetical protein [Helicobacteraceae bacterium]MDY3113785.1 hypothetical protein [Helicobacter sp.]
MESKKEFSELDFTALQVKRQDNIKKPSILDRIFKRDSSISKENLEFLEHYKQDDGFMESKDSSELLFLDDLPLQEKQEVPQISLSVSEKDEVLSLEVQKGGEIPLKFVLISFLCMIIALALFVPKIYIRNNIYYLSRDIIALRAQLDSLGEENKYIKKQLEDIKFKNLTHELDF